MENRGHAGVHAVSVSCEKLRGFFLNSYDVIEVKNGKVEAKLKIVGGDYMDFEEVIKDEKSFKL